MLRHLHAVVPLHAEDAADGELLECFLGRRDETAFKALLQRHGPMVWGVCRRVLRDTHDTEDAFQATILVLVRKAASLLARRTVGNWLYGVAYHTALKARAAAWKRRTKEHQVRSMSPTEQADADLQPDLRPLLDEELNRLPAKYREPVVLCELQGRARKDVARQLGLPEGTLSSRLATARRMLARRLTRRGLTLTEGALAAVLVREAASASVPPPLAASTAASAVLVAGRQFTVAGVVSAQVAALTEGVMKAMFMTRLKIATAVLVAAGLLGLGTVAFIRHTWAVEPQGAEGKAVAKSALPDGGGSENERDRLQGVWTVIAHDTLGRPASKEFLARNHQWIFKGDKVFIGDKDGIARQGTYALNPRTNPESIDLTLKGPGLAPGPRAVVPEREVSFGIYRLDGDTLTICFNHRAPGRPTEFVSKADPPTNLVTLRREPADRPQQVPARAARNTVKIRNAADGKVDIELTSDRAFPVVGAFPVLHIGTEKSQMSRYGDGGQTTTLIFTMSAAEFARTKNGDRIRVKYEPDSQGHWDFGKLDKGAGGKLDKGARAATELGAVTVAPYQGRVWFHDPGDEGKSYRVEVIIAKPWDAPGIRSERIAVWLLANGGKALAVKERPRGGDLVEVGSRGATASAVFLFERSVGRDELAAVVVAVDGEPKAFRVSAPSK
jgi:RNA polymerase sigma-70 factor (ECF subfamily)